MNICDGVHFTIGICSKCVAVIFYWLFFYFYLFISHAAAAPFFIPFFSVFILFCFDDVVHLMDEWSAFRNTNTFKMVNVMWSRTSKWYSYFHWFLYWTHYPFDRIIIITIRLWTSDLMFLWWYVSTLYAQCFQEFNFVLYKNRT